MRLSVLPGEERALRHWTPVHAHLAASHSTARVAVLGAGSIAPGESGRVQIVLDQPMHALAGDRIVVRDQSATRTVGGGTIIDPFSPKRGRARPARLAWLDAIETGGPERAVMRAIESTDTGVDTGWMRRAFAVTDPELERMLDAAGAVRVPDSGTDRCFSVAHWAGLGTEILAFLETFHRERPRLHGANANDIRLGVARRVSQGVVEHALASLLHDGAIARRGVTVRLPEHRVTLGTNDERIWPRVARVLDPAKGSPPSLRQAAEQLKIDEPELGALLKRATNAGLVMPVTRTRFVPLAAMRALAAHAESLAGGLPEGRFTAAEYKNHAGIGRNFAIELLECFDRSGFTERLGDRRRVRRSTAEAFGTDDDTHD